MASYIIPHLVRNVTRHATARMAPAVQRQISTSKHCLEQVTCRATSRMAPAVQRHLSTSRHCLEEVTCRATSRMALAMQRQISTSKHCLEEVTCRATSRMAPAVQRHLSTSRHCLEQVTCRATSRMAPAMQRQISTSKHCLEEVTCRATSRMAPTVQRQMSTSKHYFKEVTRRATKTKTGGGRFIGEEVEAQHDLKNSYPVVAYATCEELDLEKLIDGLIVQDLYIPTVLSDDMQDVIHVSAKYKITDEPREIFFFREGAVVFWNMPELECKNVLKFIKTFEHEGYDKEQVGKEMENMRYCYNEQGSSRLARGGGIILNVQSGNLILDKYTFANAIASSVKLGIWESTLDKFVDSIAHITEELKRAQNLNLSRKEVLQKTGELFSLRHELNLNSDLLDTPDFYWERERLESLYQKTCNYLNISRRTKVLNEKLAQCCELLDLISNHLTDQHHTRLEWMIIALITIEVGFEILHVAERYL